jgi:hypothetical protein
MRRRSRQLADMNQRAFAFENAHEPSPDQAADPGNDWFQVDDPRGLRVG